MIHKCGQCQLEFQTEQEYLEHTCNSTGFTPKDPGHLGEEFIKVSEASLQRGNARAELETKGVDPHEAKLQTADLGSEVK